MKRLTQQSLTTVLATALLFAHYTYAHDASKHKKSNAQKPKCESIQDMDHSKMDMNDPVMQAMMQQCIKDNKNHTIHKDTEQHENMRQEHNKE